MELIDTHSHIYLKDFQEDLEKVIHKAQEAGVTKIVLPNIDSATIEALHTTVEAYPGKCIPLMGLHPTHVKENYEDELNTIFKTLETNNYYGVGEIGIDLYWDKTFLEQQVDAFERQVKFSIDKELPIVIHARDSFKEILCSLKKPELKGARGIFHAFTGDDDMAAEILQMEFKLGIGGIVTFKNSGLDKTLEKVDIDHLVLETDSPYLAPTPHRGKRNESAYVALVAQKLAEIYSISVDEVARITTRNAKQVFGI